MDSSDDDLVAETEAVLQQVANLRNVTGPDDPLWPLAVSIARQVLALGPVPGGFTADEIERAVERLRQREAGQE